MQGFYCFSDTYKQKGDYPFFKKPRPSFLDWLVIYVTLPITWLQFLKFYFSRPRDINCIKKHPKYLSGKLNSKLSDMISMKKAKAKAKELDPKMTFNDLILAVVSTTFKEYFVQKGDYSKYISVNFPFTFNQIPENSKHYRFGNNFAGLTCYLPLESDFKTALIKSNKLMSEQKKSLMPAAALMLLWSYNTFFPSWWVS
jgi:hypothetical protein